MRHNAGFAMVAIALATVSWLQTVEAAFAKVVDSFADSFANEFGIAGDIRPIACLCFEWAYVDHKLSLPPVGSVPPLTHCPGTLQTGPFRSANA